MGAHGLLLTFDGNLSKAEVEKQLEQIRQDDGHESGFGSYAGNWTTIPKVNFRTTVFKSLQDAEEYCLDNSEKWSHGCAVKAQTETEIVWVVAGWAAS
jgi:hypothetical protein